MWTIFEIALDLAAALCSWRIWLCIILATALIGGVFYMFPDQDGFWPITSPIGIIIIAYGFWWELRSE